MPAQAAPVRTRPPVILWPLLAVWKLISWFANAVGILITLTLGAVFMFIGFVLISTIVGAVIGIPMFFIGALLFIRGLW